MALFFYFLSFLLFCLFARDEATGPCTVKDKIDIAILIQLNPPFNDSSPDDVKRFIRLNLRSFLIDRDHSRVAMIQFAPGPTVEWSFTDHVNRAEFEDSLDELSIQVGGTGTVVNSLIFTVFHFWSAEYGARADDPSVKKLVIAITNSPNIPQDQLDAIVSDFSSTGTDINIICANVCWETVAPPINVRRGIEGTQIDTSLATDLQKTYHCDPCYPDPCNGRGDCFAELDGSHRCVCESPYMGDACQELYFDSFCDANPGKCEHGGLCVDGPQGSYKCECNIGCSGFHCENCDDPVAEDQLACFPNPCKNGCFCVPSCQHTDGYICQSGNGFFGKNCSIPLPSVECGNEEIVVSVSQSFVSELEHGVNNTFVYVSPRPKSDGLAVCQTNLIGGEYVIRIALPFDACSMETRVDEKDGKIVVSNRVWLERQSNESWSMPIPAVSFDCKYERNYAVVSSLNPEMDNLRLKIRSSGRYNTSVQMCKVNRQCSAPCPKHLVVRDQAVYTIGDFIHFQMRLHSLNFVISQFRNSTVVLLNAKLTCNEHSVSLVERGCRTSVLPTTVSVDRPSYSVCLSFQTPRFNGCSVFYVKATLRITENRDLQECDDGHGLKYVAREKRHTKESELSGNWESIEVGPIVLRGDRLTNEKSVRVLPNDLPGPGKGWTPFAITALSFLISSLVMLTCLVAYCIARRK